MLHKVNKSFKAFGQDLVNGDVVDTGGWRNERLLLEHRYIARTDAPRPTVFLDESISKPKPAPKLVTKKKKKTSLLASPLGKKKRGRPKKAKKLTKVTQGE